MSYVDILPSNVSDEIRAVDQVGSSSIDKLSKSDFNLLPQSCKKELLPHLAYMYRLDINGLKEQEIRDYISATFEIKKYQGTHYATRLALQSIFSEALLVDFDENLEPYYFRADVKVQSKKAYGEDNFLLAIKLIDESKNARSKFDSFNLKMPLIGTNTHINTGGTQNIKMNNELHFKDAVVQINIQGAGLWTV